MKVSVYIIAGLSFRKPEDSASEGICDVLAKRLRALGCRVLVASHYEWQEVLNDVQARPAGELIVLIGHSLGGSILPTLARLAARPIAAIYGFDPADNIGANGTVYRLTPVPPNVQLASAIYVPGVGGLGGGTYTAENENRTTVKNKEVPFGHLDIDNDIERHLSIEETVRILLAA